MSTPSSMESRHNISDVAEPSSAGQIEESDARAKTANTPPPAKRRKSSVRVRVTRACDRCKLRKTRCSGTWPCNNCSQSGLECKYNATYRRGRLPPIHYGAAESALIAQASPGTNTGDDDHVYRSTSLDHDPSQQPESERDRSSRSRPPDDFQDPSQNDQQGHYVGPSSAASILLRIQRTVERQRSSVSSDSSIFTFGDLPLPDHDPSLFILPAESEGRALMARYFDFAAPTHRFLHRNTIEDWFQELYDTHGEMRKRSDKRSRTAVLLMVFAQAMIFSKSGTREQNARSSARFFSAAEQQLSGEKGSIRLTSVQARLAQCLYLLAQSRINHCWSLFGTTAHLVLALGMHRKRRPDPNFSANYIEAECRKRTFWNAYNLDTYLSVALGRPRTFHDEDIDQDLPTSVNDFDLRRREIRPVPAKSLSIMSGCIAHIELSRIMASILRDLYGIKPLSRERQQFLADKNDKALAEWRKRTSYILDGGFDDSFVLPIFLRQRNVLNLAYWHAQILIRRPFLLRNLANLTTQTSTEDRASDRHHPSGHIQQCIDAAMNIVNHVDKMSTTGQMQSTFWFTHYFAFCAVMVLYVFTIQEQNSHPQLYERLFDAGKKCQGQISEISIPGSLAERYGVVLEELRLEILRYNNYLASREQVLATNGTSGPGENQDLAGMETGPGATNGHFNGGSRNPNHNAEIGALGQLQSNQFSPLDGSTSDIAEFPDWGQFDSLVTGGLGSLDFFSSQDLDGWDIDLTTTAGTAL
ncbi:finger protein [Phyllosticta citribraziliensis]|uniref:Finger protein n=1 Tax=Phyllosticta citribraziliensis TaxID=989973 RepID=A0ABR1L451_9PEZI